MSLPLPNTARAPATLPSSPPKCTPSASTSRANIASSLMINGTENSWVTTRNARACSRRNAASAALLRYCKTRAPPSKASRTLRNNSAVSISSGVIAYNPLIRPSRLGFIVLVTARPKQTIRNMLPHAGTETCIQGLPGIFLRFFDRLRHIHALRQQCGNRGRQGATRAVIDPRQARPAIAADYPALAVQGIDDLGRLFVRAGDQHILATHAQYTFGAFLQRWIILFIILVHRETARLNAVRRKNGCLRNQQLAHRVQHVVIRQFVAASGSQHRIQHQRNIGIIRQYFGNRRPVFHTAA